MGSLDTRLHELEARVAALEADHRQLESVSGRLFQLETDMKLLQRLAHEVVEMEEKMYGPTIDLRGAAAPAQAAQPVPSQAEADFKHIYLGQPAPQQPRCNVWFRAGAPIGEVRCALPRDHSGPHMPLERQPRGGGG